eukprot:Colp12_sorted_trinity150504_noHs@2219
MPGAESNAAESDMNVVDIEQQAEAPNTIFQNRENYVKHPLNGNWVLWFDKPMPGPKPKVWMDSLNKVNEFNTIEDFWATINCIQTASNLTDKSNYHLFRTGIEPQWEDKANEAGGKWTVTFKPHNRHLDEQWLETMMLLVGEDSEDSSHINGAVVSIRGRTGNKISVWTKDATAEDVNKRIGQRIKQLLDVKEVIQYQAHKEALHTRSSYTSKNNILYEL